MSSRIYSDTYVLTASLTYIYKHIKYCKNEAGSFLSLIIEIVTYCDGIQKFSYK